MLCSACGYENRVESRSVCKRCKVPLTVEPQAVPPGTYLPVRADDLTGMFERPKALVIQSPDQALEALRSGTESERISARSYLAEVFEQRGMLAEAIELLEANANAGVTDSKLYTTLIAHYRALGRQSAADATMAHVALLMTRQQLPMAPAYHAPPPQPYYPPQPQPQQIVVNNNNVVTIGNLKNGPPLAVRFLYFIFIGIWFGPCWVICALFLICLVITAPLGLYMLYKSPKAFIL